MLQVRGLAVEVAGRLLVEDVAFTVRAHDRSEEHTSELQ